MTHLMRPLAPIAVLVVLSACSGFENPFPNPFDQSEPAATDPVDAGVDAGAPLDATNGALSAEATDADTLDTTTVLQRQEATAQAAPTEGRLGETVAALGDPVKPGFWLMTPLVTSEQEGFLVRQGGATVQVTLIPLDGAPGSGSQISLAAMRALNIGLTELATLEVFAG